MTAVKAAAAARAYVGLGSNLGDSRATLDTVLAELAAASGIRACRPSPYYRSAPVDAGGPDYVNAVAELDTTLAPLELLDLLQALEQRHGRQRPYRNAPRTLDLDLLLHGDTAMDTPRLVLPHPRMHLRAFVLRPLHDLAPQLKLPQGRLDALLAAVADQAISRLP
ncbi:2-amino-4-hydroxy-6-hydroxymethyldihydropteridine diphosphokinase [Bordetella sp. 2513F-2]